MSMNGVDYTKQLAKEREYYQDSNRKLREAAEKRIEDTNKRADHVMTKQRENFIEDRADLEKSYQNNLDTLKNKSESSASTSNSRFNEQIEKERQEFAQESQKKSRDFDQRLHEIKSSYQKAFDSEANRNDLHEKEMKEKYQGNVANIRNGTDKKLQEYQDKMSRAGTDLKDQYNRERQQLVRAQEDRLTEAQQDAATKRAELKDRIGYDGKKQREVHEAELAQQKQYTSDRLKTIQDNFSARTELMAKDYGQRNQNLATELQRNAVKTNREHQDQVDQMRRDFNDNLRVIDLDKGRRNDVSGEFNDFANRQQGLKDEVVQANKIKHLKDDLMNAQRSYEERAAKEHMAHKDLLHEQSSEATARLEKKMNMANADKLVTVARERERAETEIQNREHQNKIDKGAYEAQLMQERKSSSERISRLKENFHSSMKNLEEKNKAAVENVTETSNKDKAEFMKKVQERRADEIFEMKKAFSKMMDATIEDYEQRISGYQRENENLKNQMATKMATIIDHMEKQLESQKVLFDNRRETDILSQQMEISYKDNLHRKNISELNTGFQKKLDKMQAENDTKFKLMSNEYESKLKELKAKQDKEDALKHVAHQIEIERVKKAHDEEKNRLVEAYEVQLKSVKEGAEERIRNMADFKKLS